VVSCKTIPCSKRSNMTLKMVKTRRNNVIQFPTPMRREEVELLACEKELKEVADKVKALSRDLETAHKYLKELINEQEVLKDAVDRNIDLLFFDGDEWDE
jgi:hypothetical protein